MATPNFADKTIWTGDNLDILRGMNSECVDLIYLDPPFNSNQNYSAPVGSKAAGAAFKDTWTLSDLDVAWMGLIADEQPATANLLRTAGMTHGKGMQSYLTMMAVRLIEMHRVLKPTGSIYCHCDPTASHYLKLLMDAVFGAHDFRNEITWVRSLPHNDAHRFGRSRDTILWYTQSKDAQFFPQYRPQKEASIKAHYYKNGDGRLYRLASLIAPGGRGPRYEFKGFVRNWRFTQENMFALEEEGRIWYEVGKVPQRILYLDESKGVLVQDHWDDIAPINAMAKERVGFPTQKPLALLERIINASSNENDVVLDPFCGCATACVAADRLGRKWVGIDISPKAVELVNMRLQDAMGSLFYHGYVTARTDIPQRTDTDKPKPYRENKHILFGQQEGLCNGCKGDFPFKLFEVDHVVPKSKGGTDHLANLQLLCGSCNKIKGDRPQEYLIAQLKEYTYA